MQVRVHGTLLPAAAALSLLLFACGGSEAALVESPDVVTPTATATARATPTPRATATATATATAEPSPTPTLAPPPATAGQSSPETSTAPDGGAGSYTEPTGRPTGVDIAAFSIPSQGVSAAVEYLGILPSNELDNPHNPYNVGWYYLYDFPGVPGNAVFSGHVDYFPNIRGPFYALAGLGVGESIVISLTDGTQARYEVIRNVRYSVSSIPMGEVIWPSDRPADEQWVTVITCGGEFRATTASGAGEYLHRDVVTARRVE